MTIPRQVSRCHARLRNLGHSEPGQRSAAAQRPGGAGGLQVPACTTLAAAAPAGEVKWLWPGPGR